jgi:hypothetical protein
MGWPQIVNGLKLVGGGASEIIAPGNPIGIGLMGSGIGGLAGQAAGGNTGGSIGSMLGGMGGSFAGGGFDPTSMMSGGGSAGGNFDPGAAMGMSGAMDPMNTTAMGFPPSMAGGAAGPGMAGVTAMANPSAGGGGIMNAMFGSPGPSAQDLINQGMDPLQAYQITMLNKMANPSMFQQAMGAMGPAGLQLMQNRQNQQLEMMRHQAPTANLQGGPNPVSPNFGVAASSVNPGMSERYMSILESLSR